MTDIRTYDAISTHMSHLQQAQDEIARLRTSHAHVVEHAQTLTETLDTALEKQYALQDEVTRLRAELARQQDMATHAIQAARTAQDNAAELGKALDMALAERDAAYREVDAQTLKANSFRSELHRYTVHARELKEMLDISVVEKDALRAELDAVKRDYSVIAARCEAMGC